MAVLALLNGCGGSTQQQEQAYQIKIESVAEIVAGQATACLSQIRSYWAVAEYARVSDLSFEDAAREMQTGQTQQNLNTMRDMKARIDGLMDGLREPPEAYAEAFPLLEELYSAYVEAHEFALEPSGDMGKLAETISALEADLQEKAAALNQELAAAALY
jgi:hypothetical protein